MKLEKGQTDINSNMITMNSDKSHVNKSQNYDHDLHIITYNLDEFEGQEDIVRDTEDLPFISKRSEFVYRFLSVVFTLIITVILLFMVIDSPVSSVRENNPTVNEVSQRYLSKGLEEAGATNIVAGLILDYRAFDTLGEATMVFTAAMGVIFIVKDIWGKREGD